MNYRVRVGEVVSCPGGQGVRLSSVDARQTVGFIPPMCHSCPQMIKEKSAFFFFFQLHEILEMFFALLQLITVKNLSHFMCK